MTLLEGSWFLITVSIIAIVLLVDPKSSLTASPVVGLFSSASSGQQFIYNIGAVLISLFFVLTVFLSLNN